MKTFLELLNDKIYQAEDLLRLANVWRLAGNSVGAASISDSSPSLANLEKLAAAREQCQRLIVLLPASAQPHSLLWSHSALIDAILFYEDKPEAFLDALQADIVQKA